MCILHLLHWQADSLPLHHLGSPRKSSYTLWNLGVPEIFLWGVWRSTNFPDWSYLLLTHTMGFTFFFFSRKAFLVPEYHHFSPQGPCILEKEQTVKFYNLVLEWICGRGKYFKESKESLYIFNIYKCLWNLDQEKTCTVKGVLNQQIYKQYSLRAKITNPFLDICLFLIFIVSHTELNIFGLVL